MRTEGVGAPCLGERLLFWLFPARCLGCGEAVGPQGFFCPSCGAALPRACRRRFSLPGTGQTLEALAPMPYAGGCRRTLHRYKFQGERGLAGQMGRLLAATALGYGVGFQGAAYVPLSRAGKRRRGYDQSRLLAKSLAKALGIPLLDILEKARETEIQHSLGRAARLENVKGAYRARGGAEGKDVLLVDDIVTTGATLCQCAGALYQAGAKRVYGLCAASAGRGQEA